MGVVSSGHAITLILGNKEKTGSRIYLSGGTLGETDDGHPLLGVGSASGGGGGGVLTGLGNPNGVVVADIGTLYLQLDAAAGGWALWTKISGGTTSSGWIQDTADTANRRFTWFGTGSPEGVYNAPYGTMYIQQDASPLANPLWVRYGQKYTYTTLAHDNFGASNTSSSTADIDGWTWYSPNTVSYSKNSFFPSGDIAITGAPNPHGTSSVAADSLYNTAGLSLPSADYACQISFEYFGTGAARWVGCGVRTITGHYSGYVAELELDTGDLWLYDLTDADYTVPLGNVTVSISHLAGTGHTLEVRAVGTTIECLFDGIVQISAQSSHYTAAGLPSIYTYGLSTSQYFLTGTTVSSIALNAATGWRQFGGLEGNYPDSIFIGTSAVVGGPGAIAIGKRAQATAGGNTDSAAVAVGVDARALGQDSVAIGNLVVADGLWTVAIGFSCSATGSDAIAIGVGSGAGGASGVAIGDSSTANGTNSIAIGTGATSTIDNFIQIGQGKASLNFGSGALATTDTNGFFYAPSCAGAPTGTPTSLTGRIPVVFDSTNNKLYAYLNSAWKSVTLV